MVTESQHDMSYASDDGYYAQPRVEFQTHLALLRATSVRMSGRALDIGCGEGHLGRLLLDAGFAEVVGVEPNSYAAGRAHTRLTTVISTPFPSREVEDMAPYDLVVFADSLEHIVDPWSALDVAARCLTPDGYLLVSVPNVSHYSVILQQVRGRWDYANEGLLDRGHLRFFTPATLHEALAANGFSVIGSTHSTRRPHRRMVTPAVALLERWRPHLFWYQALAVARRA